MAKDIFEYIYQKYYVEFIEKIHQRASDDKEFYPSVKEQEKIIEECKYVDCDFRFIDDPMEDTIKALYTGDRLYPFPSEIKNKRFFTYIHTAYLIPYFIYGAFAYELAKEIQAPWRQLIKMNYRILLPLKLPGSQEYFWFTQTSRILTISETNQVLSHVNIYERVRKFQEFKERPESMFIEATIFSNKEVYEQFQQMLENKMTEYYKQKVFKLKHWVVLKARVNNQKEIVKKNGKMYKPYSISSIHKEIGNLIHSHTGYRFIDIDEIVAYLKDIKVLSNDGDA